MSDGADPADPFAALPHDPRDPALARVRAADRDRAAATDALADAYADGRLDRAEYDRRVEAALGATYLGDLTPLLADLAPAGAVARRGTDDLDARATDAWRRKLRRDLTGAASLTVLTTGIWGATSLASGGPYFFWPVFPIVAALVGLVEPLFNRQEVIGRERRRLERRRRAELEGSAEPGDDTGDEDDEDRAHGFHGDPVAERHDARRRARAARDEARDRRHQYRRRHW